MEQEIPETAAGAGPEAEKETEALAESKPQEESSGSTPTRDRGFRLPVRKRVLAGIGTILGTMVAAAIQFDDLRNLVTSIRPKVGQVKPKGSTTSPVPLNKKACCSVEIKHPPIIPLNLFPRLPHPEHFPYWFKVIAENNCKEELTIDIEFERYRGPFAIDKDSQQFSDTLPVGAYSRRVDPAISISDYDSKKPMAIKWTVRDKLGTLLDQHTTDDIELLPRSVIAWDLRNADGQAVSREYLFASLAAWTATSVPELKKMAEACRKVEPSASSLESAARLQDCHRRLFVDTVNPVFVSDSPVRFPTESRQTVLPPFKVLESRHANQIEAALLFAALGRHLGPRFRLIGRPDPAGGGLKNFLLAWQSTSAADWLAVDLGKSPSIGFDENLRAGTEELSQMLRNRPDIFQALDMTGVYLDDFYAAIDFGQANRHYDIGRLPS